MHTPVPDLDKAFDVALEIDKQITAISTAVLALTAVFLDSDTRLSLTERRLLGASWVGFGVAVLLGVIILMIATGRLTTKPPSQVVNAGDFKTASGAQILSFLAAVIFMVVFAIMRL